MSLLDDVGSFLKKDVINPVESVFNGSSNRPGQTQVINRPNQPQQIQQGPQPPKLILKTNNPNSLSKGIMAGNGNSSPSFANSAPQAPHLIQRNPLTKNPLVQNTPHIGPGNASKPGPTSTMKIASATPPRKNGMSSIKINVIPKVLTQPKLSNQVPQESISGTAPFKSNIQLDNPSNPKLPFNQRINQINSAPQAPAVNPALRDILRVTPTHQGIVGKVTHGLASGLESGLATSARGIEETPGLKQSSNFLAKEALKVIGVKTNNEQANINKGIKILQKDATRQSKIAGKGIVAKGSELVGNIAPAVGTSIINPIVGAGEFYEMGAGQTYNLAKQAGLSEPDSRRAAVGVGLLYAAAGPILKIVATGGDILTNKALPVAVRQLFAESVAGNPVAKFAVNQFVRGAIGSATNTGLQLGQNTALKLAGDKKLSLGSNLAPSAALGGGLGIGLGATSDILHSSPQFIKALDQHFSKVKGVTDYNGDDLDEYGAKIAELDHNEPASHTRGATRAEQFSQPVDMQTTVHSDETPITEKELLNDVSTNTGRVAANSREGELTLGKALVDSSRNPQGEENVYRALETGDTSGLSEDEVEQYEQAKRLQAQQRELENEKRELQGKTKLKDNQGGFVHRIAKGVDSALDKVFERRSNRLSQSATRQTVDSEHKTTVYEGNDTKGNRALFVDTPIKDDENHITGHRLTRLSKTTPETETQAEDMGEMKVKSNEAFKESEIKPLKSRLVTIMNRLKGTMASKESLSAIERRLNTLSHNISTLLDREETSGMSEKDKADLKSMIKQAKTLSTLRGDAIKRAQGLFDISKMLNDKLQEIEDKYDENDLKEKAFKDKNGTVWTLKRADTNFVESNSDIRYYKKGLFNTVKDLIDTRSANARVKLVHWIKTHPQADQMISTTYKEGWVNGGTVDPSLRDFYVNPKVAKIWERQLGPTETQNPAEIHKIIQGINNTYVSGIVFNPIIHGLNLTVQLYKTLGNTPLFNGTRVASGPIGALKALPSIIDFISHPDDLDYTVHQMTRDGVYVSKYGSNVDTKVNALLDKMGLPHVNKASGIAMSSIEATLKAIAYKTLTDSGMDGEEAARQIGSFMGAKPHASLVAEDMGMFYHWLSTETNSMKASLIHPIKNLGATINIMTMPAIMLGLNKALQDFTGNKNAYFRKSGEFGLETDLYHIVHDAITNQWIQLESDVASLLQSHVSPVLNAVSNQIAGKDLYSGDQVVTPKQREQEFLQNINPFNQEMSNVGSQKKSAAEQAANTLFGVYTPHAKGNPAVTRGAFKFMNTSGSKAATPIKIGKKVINDPTGYQQEQIYYNALDTYVLNNQSLSSTAQQAAQAFLTKNKTPTGQTILNSPDQTAANWGEIAANPSALYAYQKMEQNSGGNGPEWNLSGNGTISGKSVPKMLIYATYKSLKEGDPEKTVLADQNPWINTTETAQLNYENHQVYSKNAVESKGYVPYPNLTTEQNNLMTLDSKLSAVSPTKRTQNQINQLNALDNNPQLQNAYTAIEKYTNAVRASENVTQLNYGPNTPPAVQDWINAYDAADEATRTTMRTSNPSMYAQMQQTEENQDLTTNEKQGAIAYLGGKPSQSYLSSGYGLADYDINKVTNPNGTSTYSLTNFGGGPLDSSGLPVMNAVGGYAPDSLSQSDSSSDDSKPPFSTIMHPRLPKLAKIGKPYKNKPLTMKKQTAKKKQTAIKIGKPQKIKFVKQKGLKLVAKAPGRNAIKMTGTLNNTGIKFAG